MNPQNSSEHDDEKSSMSLIEIEPFTSSLESAEVNNDTLLKANLYYNTLQRSTLEIKNNNSYFIQ
jgi:hypothetical protein